MGYFDAIGKKITQTGQGVVQKTKDTAEVLKLNGLISDEQKRIDNYYREMGKLYFNLHADSCEPDFAESVAGIRDALSKIETYSEQIKKLKGLTNCPNCGSTVSYNAPFCASCGAKLNQQTPNNAPLCASCGMPLAENAAFCTNCGAKVAPAAPAQPPVAPAEPVAPAPVQPPVEPVAPAPAPVEPVAPVQTPAEPVAPAPVQPPVAPVAPATVFCANCGKQLPAGTAFCTACGSRLNG